MARQRDGTRRAVSDLQPGLLRRLVQRRGRPRRRLLVGPRRSLTHGLSFRDDHRGHVRHQRLVRCVLRRPAADGDGDGHRPTRHDAAAGDERLPRARSGRQRLVQPRRRVDVRRLRRNIRDRVVRRPDLLRPGQRLRDRRRGVPRRRRQHERARWLSRSSTTRTAPAAGASLARGPDANGWYSKPITVSFAGSDATSGIASCTAPGTYTGPDAAAASVVGNCTDAAGNRTSAAASIPYDSTPPSVVAVPDRPPDANGWYSKPLSISFKGNDKGSGVASCTPPIRYASPDGADAKATGTCRDEAGNMSSPATMSFKFDATPPTAPAVKIVAGGGSVTLEWAERGRRGKLRGPARGGREARPRIGAVAWHRPPLRRPLGQEWDALPLCRSRARPGREYRREERRRDAATARLRARSRNGDAGRPARSLGCRPEGALLQRPGLPWPHEGAQPLAHDGPVPDSPVMGPSEAVE